jgi:hypothetical protein
LGDFNALTTKPSTNDEIQKEFEKLDLEIYHASVFQLRYQSYQYYLEFRNIEIDPSTNAAKAEVIEDCDVVFEISAPSVSKMRDQQHLISLQKEDGAWKITADSYDDYLWRVLKVKKISDSDFKKGIYEAGKQWKMQLANAKKLFNNSTKRTKSGILSG